MKNKSIFYYSRLGNVKLFIKYIIKKNKNIEEIEPSTGYRAIHYASFYGNLDIVKILYERFANLDCTTNSGKTPLHIAVLNSKYEIVEYLYDKCDISISDFFGNTILHTAAIKNDRKMLEKFIYINSVEIWIDLNNKTNDNVTLYDLCKKNCLLDIYQAIVDNSVPLSYNIL